LLSDIGFPGADEPTVFAAPRVDCDINPVAHLAQAPDSCFAVVEAVIYAFKNFTVEQGQHIDEVDSVIASRSFTSALVSTFLMANPQQPPAPTRR
jgi:hypothetical protein